MSGTSNLKHHLLKCFAYLDSNKKPENEKVDKQAYREALAKAIIKHGYPFIWVEHERTREVHALLNNNVEHVSRNTIRVDCLKLHNKMKKKLKSALDKILSRICLTSDLWTSCSTKGFICLIAHYVDENWKLQSKILNFCHVPPPHNANLLCNTVHSFLRD